VTVTNSTVSTNTVSGGSGGQFSAFGGVSQGGGIWVDGEDDDTRLDLFNSTVAGNTAFDSTGTTNTPGQGGGLFNTDGGADAAARAADRQSGCQQGGQPEGPDDRPARLRPAHRRRQGRHRRLRGGRELKPVRWCIPR